MRHSVTVALVEALDAADRRLLRALARKRQDRVRIDKERRLVMKRSSGLETWQHAA